MPNLRSMHLREAAEALMAWYAIGPGPDQKVVKLVPTIPKSARMVGKPPKRGWTQPETGPERAARIRDLARAKP